MTVFALKKSGLKLPVKATEKDAIRALLRDRWRSSFCLPRYEPKGWWQCDIFELTTAGYFREFEIKLTLADFRHDREKSRAVKDSGRWMDGPGERGSWVVDFESKHTLLLNKDERGPVQFYYVTPPGLIPRSELPLWAGLIELSAGPFSQAKGRVTEQEIVPAPRLHNTKLSDKIVTHARGVCYWRLLSLLVEGAD